MSGYFGTGSGGGIGGSTGSRDNALLRADGTGGSSLQSGTTTDLDDDGKIKFNGNQLDCVTFANGYFVGTNSGRTYFRGAGYQFTDASSNDVFGTNSTTNAFYSYKGANVASAAAIVPTGNLFHVTGTTSITSITSTNIVAGTRITIIFDGALTFTDGSNLKLAGNFVTTADDTITLVYDGTNWYEICRSVN